MNAICGCVRFGLDDDAGRPADPAGDAARELHLASCPACREELVKIAAQRATVRDAYATDRVPPDLTEVLVRRCLAAMERACADDPPPDEPTR
jgi:anti-sigma factor RsiW